ncbi:MAG: restriction endonuclease subunit S [Campylobacterota bacterium]|nr:restriction endonuclease subunit S [Campylobacterota bacterium]
MNKLERYSSYKDSGAQWLEEIPEHWEVVKIKYLMDEKKKTHNITLNCGSISFGKVVYKDDEKIPLSTKKAYQVVEKGNFLVNPLNLNYDLKSLRIALSDLNVVVSSGYIVLDILRDINKSYLNYLLHRFDVSFMKTLGAGVRQTLNYTDISECELVEPPKQEQIKIASFLDTKTEQLDKAIKQKEQLIELLKERREILINDAVTKGEMRQNHQLLDDFSIGTKGDVQSTADGVQRAMKDSGVEWIGEIPEGWEVKKLKYVSNIFRGKFTHRPRNDSRLYDGAYPFFQTGDIARAGKYLSAYKQTLNEKGLKVSTLFPKGTIVVTIAANIGDVSILDIDACFPDSIVGFSPLICITNQFLYHTLTVMKDVFMSSTIKNTQMNLNIDRIGSNLISLPSIQEQEAIINYIEKNNQKIDKAIDLQQQQITKLKEYKTTLIDSVVTGKVRVV